MADRRYDSIPKGTVLRGYNGKKVAEVQESREDKDRATLIGLEAFMAERRKRLQRTRYTYLDGPRL